MKPSHVILLFDALLLAAGLLLSFQGEQAVAFYVLCAAGGIGFWQLVLYRLAGSPDKAFRFEVSLKKPHYVQAMLQVCLYLYWGLYWTQVRDYVPLLLVQLIFAYVFESTLAWSKRRIWYLGLGPFPIVLSINLFLWFKADYYYCQFLLIALTYVAKEFFTWTRDGRKRHIFNPSGCSLAMVSVGLMLTGSTEFTRGVDIVSSFLLPPSFYEVVFLLGLVVQCLFATTLVTLGAATSLCLLFVGAAMILGRPIFLVSIDLSVLLGITLLVTDPSTSPRSQVGKFLFGLIYGVGIFFTHIGLRYINQPGYFDKILMVPVVNLLTPMLDRAGAAITDRIKFTSRLSNLPYARFAPVPVYAVVFLVVVPDLKDPPGDFKSPLPGNVAMLSDDLGKTLFNYTYSRQAYPEVYKPFGFGSEVAKYHSVIEIYGRDLKDNPLNRNQVRQRKLAEQAEQFRRVIARAPRNADAHHQLGIVLGRLQDIEGAIRHLRRSLAIKPDNPGAHFDMGVALEMSGDPVSAVGHFRHSMRLAPSWPQPPNSLARLLSTSSDAAVRDPAEAVKLARRATAAAGGKSFAMFETLAVAHAAAGQFDQAVAAAQTAIELADDEGQDAAVKRLREKLTLFQNGESYPP